MAINFPVSLDDFANVSTGDTITPAHKNDLNDAVEALMAKVGIDNSSVATSHDYKFIRLPAQAVDWDAGAVEVRAQTFESDVATGTAPFTIASTTVSTNLNADTVDGKHVAGTNGAGEITTNDGTQTLTNKTLTSPTLNSPTCVTPVLGAATATSINGLTIDTTTGTLDITNAKTLAVTGDATISGTPYTPSGTDVAVADGGTGASTAAGGLNNLLPSQTGNANKFLESDGSNASWQTVNLATADVTGTLPIANGGTASTSTTYCNLASNVTGTLPTANGGTGSTAAANAASGVVVLDASSKLPAVDGSQLTGLSAVTQVNDTETTGTTFDDSPVVTFLSVDKTITSGKTVFVMATGYIGLSDSYPAGDCTITLKHGSTAIQTVLMEVADDEAAWAASGVVTGLSGSVTFSVTVVGSHGGKAYGKLTVLEF